MGGANRFWQFYSLSLTSTSIHTQHNVRDSMNEHRELTAEELAEDEDGMALLRAAASMALAPHELAAQPRAVEQFQRCVWSANYFDKTIDDGAYSAMAADATRTPLFAEALRRRLRQCPNAVVLDIGSG